MKVRPSRIVFTSLAALIGCALLGGWLGSTVQARTVQSTTTKADDADSSLKLYTSLLGLVEENYATKVDSDKAVYGSIDGMLRTLDPHSHFFDPKAFTAMMEDERGKYFGLGITITARFGKVTVVSPPFKNSPAEKADLRVGDVISKINGEPTDNMDLNTVISKLKGPRGTSVGISIVRSGAPEPLQISITRDQIDKYTINNVFLIQPRIGYIKLDSFADTSGAELRDALKKLDYKNLDGLIFDLRGNPGGVLPQAIAVAETFLQKGQAILETRGRVAGSSHTYTSTKVNTDNLYPLVVLTDRNSASASEIVSGALQDHDRALIVGDTTFGKGLVQSVYPLSNRSGLALTTQKWYTPSGRLIQRDYSHVSEFDYYNHLDSASKEQKKDDIKHSDLGRIVYGGGGITPDYKIDEPKANDFQASLAQHYAFFTFARDYLGTNPTITDSFQVSDALLASFKQHLQKRNIAFTEQDFQANKDYLKRMILNELFYDKLGVAEATKVLLEGDPQVLKAITLLPEARDLENKAKDAMTQKQGARP